MPSYISNHAVRLPAAFSVQDDTVAAEAVKIEPPLRVAVTIVGVKVLNVTAVPAVPAAQVVPPLVLYCQLAPSSKPWTRMRPLVVMPSLLLLPVSKAKLTEGADAAVLSTVTAPIAGLLALVLPAAFD